MAVKEEKIAHSGNRESVDRIDDPSSDSAIQLTQVALRRT
jgi:hypothetical protein